MKITKKTSHIIFNIAFIAYFINFFIRGYELNEYFFMVALAFVFSNLIYYLENNEPDPDAKFENGSPIPTKRPENPE